MCWEDQKIARKKYIAASHKGNQAGVTTFALSPNIYRCGVIIRTDLPVASTIDEWQAIVYSGTSAIDANIVNSITKYDDGIMRIEDFGQAIQGPLFIGFNTSGPDFNWYIIEVALNYKNELDE